MISLHRRERPRSIGIALLGTVVLAVGLMVGASATADPSSARRAGLTSSRAVLKRGVIKHVWLIILENKSYDAIFTGLNQNSYLWKTLPAQGVLLKNYYGTGHFSMDNYLSMISGQAPVSDTQSDCNVENFDIGTIADIIQRGRNRGQVASPANAGQPSGGNAPNGTNGCTYPSDTATLFNQLDAAGKTWKGYAQDFRNQPGREDAACGAPGTADNDPSTNPRFMKASATHPLPPGVASFTGAQANDQYVAKHFPFGWFHSLTGSVTANGTEPALTSPVGGGSDCDSLHVANLDEPDTGLFHDLQEESRTPAFSWITPNNCSDAHDAICVGNNLSGSFDATGRPVYQSPPNPQSTQPHNHTGGLYAADLFLEYYVPMIERSSAFRDGGLIDITFDEGFPPFTYTGNSFNNANAYGPTLDDRPDVSSSLRFDQAGENLDGRNVHWEPTGPNSTLGADPDGNQLYPGPGYNAFVDRAACDATPTQPYCISGLVLGGGDTPPGSRTDSVAANASSTYVEDPAIVADDNGRIVTDTADATGPGGTSPIPAGTFVGPVSDTGPQYPTTSTGSVINGSFQLVDAAGNAVKPTGAVSKIKLSAEGIPGHLQPGQTPDPLFDATHPTRGGGKTGSVLISPYIRPGTSSTTFYNHYSWLRTMEDLFSVNRGSDHRRLVVGTVSGGIDGEGHLGFAAQDGLRPFGHDVFNNPRGAP